MAINQSTLETARNRFLKYVSPEPNSGCWLWIGATTNDGYGAFSIGSAHRGQMANRISCQMAKGPIPEGLYIDHLCRVKCCVNPDHLEAVTNSVNILRGHSPERDQTHCKRGHPFDEANTYLYRGKLRRCRACKVFRRRLAGVMPRRGCRV